MTMELKTPGDDLTRGLEQVAEALAFGYNRAAIVTTLRRAKRANPSDTPLFTLFTPFTVYGTQTGVVHLGNLKEYPPKD